MRRPAPSVLMIGLALVPILIDLLSSTPALSQPPELPLTGSGFFAEDIGFTTAEATMLARVPVTKRRYIVDAQQVLVLAMDATANRHAIHDPTYCLQGAGWRVAVDEQRSVPAGHVRVVRAERASTGEVRRIVCFFRSGDQLYTTTARFLGDFVIARWWPGKTRPLTFMIAVTTGHDGMTEDWIVGTVLPRLLAPAAP